MQDYSKTYCINANLVQISNNNYFIIIYSFSLSVKHLLLTIC